MSYSEKKKIAFIYEKDGAFTVNDYNKVSLLYGLCHSAAFRQVSIKCSHSCNIRVSA